MTAVRPFALVQTRDQWLRLSHEGTALDAQTDAVELDWTLPPGAEAPGASPATAAGLAFDSRCRLYHALPEEGRVERALWAPEDSSDLLQPAQDFVGTAAPPASMGDFQPVPDAGAPGVLRTPRGLAVDVDDRLYVAETGLGAVRVFDLWDRRILATVRFATPDGRTPTPLDVSASGDRVLAVCDGPPSVFRMGARRAPSPAFEAVWPQLTAPSRIAQSPSGRAVVLDQANTAAARIVVLDAPALSFAAPWASDVEFESEDALVVARLPGWDFLRADMRKGRVGQWLPPLRARGYDGRGIVLLPKAPARIGFWTAGGFRAAVPARVVFGREGRVVTFRLDSGEYQTRWGRVFLDACIPDGTNVQVGFITRDEVEDDEPLWPAFVPPRHASEVAALVPQTPPMPPSAELADLPLFPLYERETGRELPWATKDPLDPFHTFEAPIAALPGRYLWVVLVLSGNTRTTPRVRSLRAERPAHDLLRRLPKTFSREEAQAAFLQRALAAPEGLLALMDARAAQRHFLLNPRSTPAELLPWLGSFIGLWVDLRWNEQAQRTFVEEAATLFRLRGTVRSLERMIEIVTGVKPVLLEHFRLRGLALSNPVVGGGFRVGGQVGEPGETPVTGTLDDAFRATAHRFSVLVPKVLCEEELASVRTILEMHRPAHTLYELCTVDAGMRVGRGLLLEISTVIGRTGGFDSLVVGQGVLGIESLLGRARAGTVPGQSRLGQDARVG